MKNFISSRDISNGNFDNSLRDEILQDVEGAKRNVKNILNLPFDENNIVKLRILVEYFDWDEPFANYLINELYNFYIKNIKIIVQHSYVLQTLLDLFYHNPFVFSDSAKSIEFLDKTFPILQKNKNEVRDFDFSEAVHKYLLIIIQKNLFPLGVDLLLKFIKDNPDKPFAMDVKSTLKQNGYA